jgi:hypothetical protein
MDEICVAITIIANDIVHVTSRAIAVLLVVEEQRGSADTRYATQRTETGGTTPNDDNIVVCLGDRHSRRETPQRQDKGQNGPNSGNHDDAPNEEKDPRNTREETTTQRNSGEGYASSFISCWI